MDYDKLIHEYVDGSIEAGKEFELFSILAQNDELRQEFRNHIAIKNAIHSDIKAFTPKAESTMKIFSTLGFDAPIPVSIPTPAPTPLTPIATGFWANLGLSSSKIIPIVSGSLISAGLTAAILLLFLKPDIFGIFNSSNNSENVGNSNIAVVESYSLDNPENNYLKYFISDKNGLAKAEKLSPRVVYKYILVERNDKNESGINNTVEEGEIQKTSTGNYNLVTESGIVPVKLIAPHEFDSNNINPTTISSPFNFEDLTKYFALNSELGIGIEVRGNEAFYSNKERISPSEKQQFNNSAIAVYYKPLSEVSFGVEYRRENFYQVFKGYEQNRLFTYEQQPNFETFNFAMRYIPEFAKYIFLQPFAQISYGISEKSNNIGRVMVGTEISPNPGWTFMFGGEYSYMGYNYQSNSFYSDKFGLNIGIALKF